MEPLPALTGKVTTAGYGRFESSILVNNKVSYLPEYATPAAALLFVT